MLAQLDYLIEQNSQLSIAEEKLRNEDSLAGFSTLTLLPMLFAVLKLLLDLMLFLQISTTFMQNNVTLPFQGVVMRALLEEYGATIIMIILSSGIIGLLMTVLNYILTGQIWATWGL